MDEDRLIQVTNPSDGQLLCRTCYWVHMQKGYRESEEMVLCNYGWQLRRVPFKVCDCTDYQNRTMPNRKEMEDIAWIIATGPKRRSAGAGGIGFAVTQGHEDEDLVSTME